MHTVLPCARENGRSGSRRPRVHCRLESPIPPRLSTEGSCSHRSPPPTRRARKSRRDGDTPKERDTRVRRAPSQGQASRGRNRHNLRPPVLQRTGEGREQKQAHHKDDMRVQYLWQPVLDSDAQVLKPTGGASREDYLKTTHRAEDFKKLPTAESAPPTAAMASH